jgi:hypothetical protein
MRFKTLLFFLLSFYRLVGHCQSNDQTTVLDSSLAKKITVSGFCLCQTSLSDLGKLSGDLKKIDVEEMDLGKKCKSQDSRFENGKGYYSDQFPGIIFQKDQNSDQISKIRLTRDFKGNLPDGTPVDVRNLKLKDVFNIYPQLKDSWNSRGCSDYWSFANDTLFFYVKIDTTKKPQFPIDEAYYYDKPIEAIDLLVSCYGIFEKKEPYKQLGKDPVLFLDSVNITRVDMLGYNPNDIAEVVVYKDTNAIRLVGEQGKFGVVYVETKKFARNKYWNYFKSKSADYLKVVPAPESDSSVIYILNGEILKTNFEWKLAKIDDKNFIRLDIIDQQKLEKYFSISGKSFGVIIRTKPEEKKD